MKPTLFLSDLHLAPVRPVPVAAFDALARGPAREASAVYILGDLFDWWVGDDQMVDPFIAGIVGSLRSISDAGIRLHVARGNRDFLLGERFARAIGASLLPEQLALELHGVVTVLSHGDELCTDDVSYQRYRARVLNPVWQRRFLRFPYPMRRAFALWLRRRSRNLKALKPESITDVNADAVAATLRRFDATRLIHGHTHRPATHALVVDNRACERIVLADWHDSGHYLRVDADGCTPTTIGGL